MVINILFKYKYCLRKILGKKVITQRIPWTWSGHSTLLDYHHIHHRLSPLFVPKHRYRSLRGKNSLEVKLQVMNLNYCLVHRRLHQKKRDV